MLSQVFDHDEQARKEQLSPQARLAYHQAQSQPLMDALKTWLDRQLDERLVEPNSSLGKALAGVRPCLAPVLKLRGSLVQLVLRVQRGFDVHDCLQVITFLA